MKVEIDETGEAFCEHGTALDLHCCGEGGLLYPGCHSGFLISPDDCRCLVAGDDDEREALEPAA